MGFARLGHAIDPAAVLDDVRIRSWDGQFNGDPGHTRGALHDGLHRRDQAFRGRVSEILVDDVNRIIDAGAERVRDEPAVSGRTEPSDRLLSSRIQEVGNWRADDADAPLLMAGEGPSRPPYFVSRLPRGEGQRLHVLKKTHLP